MPDPPRFCRVLVAVDGSVHAQLALAQAIALARRDHGLLTILGVAPEATASGAASFSVPVDPAALQADIDRETQAIVRAAVDQVPGDMSVRSRVRHGHAGPEIVAEVREGSHDAVVLGARGLGRIGSLFGSVSQHVLHHAGVAVFVAHAPTETAERDAG